MLKNAINCTCALYKKDHPGCLLEAWLLRKYAKSASASAVVTHGVKHATRVSIALALEAVGEA